MRTDHEPRPRFHAGAPGLQHGHQADRARLLERHPERARDLGRLLRGLDEHLDRAVAPEPEPPHGVVVGGEVPARQARGPFIHHDPGDVRNVALEAAAADVADRRPLFGDQEPGPRSAVRGPADRHDRGERHALTPGGQGHDRCEDVADLAHAVMLAQVAASVRRGVPVAERRAGSG